MPLIIILQYYIILIIIINGNKFPNYQYTILYILFYQIWKLMRNCKESLETNV